MSYIKIQKIKKDDVDIPEEGYVYLGFDDDTVEGTGKGLWLKDDDGTEAYYVLVNSSSAPIITSITPIVSAFNGDTITINGSNFITSLTSVKFSTTSGTFLGDNISVISVTQLLVDVPYGVSGDVDITVETLYGVSSPVSYIINFRNEAPVIVSISPLATSSIDSTIYITGYNFLAGETTISYGGLTGITNVTNSTYLSAIIPYVQTGQTILFLSTSRGQGNAVDYIITNSINATFTSFIPSSGSFGDTIIITGSNFVDGEIPVYIGGIYATDIVVQDSTTITAKISTNTPLSKTNIRVNNSTLSGFTVNGVSTSYEPVITSITPVGQSKGTNVNIIGSNLEDVTVTFSNVLVNVITGSTSTNCEVYLNDDIIPGNNTVRVINKYGVTTTTYIIPQTTYGPTITSTIPPNHTKGSMIFIEGTNFIFPGTGNAVYFGNVPITTGHLDGITAERIKCQIPLDAPTGSVDIKVINSNGDYTYATFIINAVGTTPTISSVSTNFGKAGDNVTVIGTNLTDSFISFGYSYPGSYTTTTVVSDSELQTTIPINIVSNGENRLMNLYVTSDTGTTISTIPFDVYATPLLGPIITSVSSSTCSVGDTITITGNYFNKYYTTSSIYVNSIYYVLDEQKYVSNTTITGKIPNIGGYTGPTVIKVSNQVGSNQLSGVSIV